MRFINHYTAHKIFNPSTGKKFKINGFEIVHKLSGIRFFLGRMYNGLEQMRMDSWAVYELKTGLPMYMQFSGSRESVIKRAKKLLDDKVKKEGIESLNNFLNSEFEKQTENEKLKRT